jgi:RNA polymerase sigma-70 factor (ECF subfamily)
MNADDAMSEYARGDDKAFAVVYDAVAPRLEGYLRRHVRECALIDDIIQQTFLQMHDKRGTFCLGAKVVPWAFSIARNFMIDTLRKTKRETAADLSDENTLLGAVLVATLPTAEQVVQAKEAGASLMSAYGRLTPHQRRAYELVNADGLSQAEAAESMGASVMAVKQCIHKATRKLRAALFGTDGEPGPTTPTPAPATLGGPST